MKTNATSLIVVCSLCSFIPPSLAQLSLTPGVDPNAGPNGAYAAVQFSNFSDAGAGGTSASGTGNNLFGIRPESWAQQIYNITFSYAPTFNNDGLSVNNGGVSTAISIPPIAPNELQILVANSGVGDLSLNLTSINSVAYGGVLNTVGGYPVLGGAPPTFTSGSTLSAANGTTLQAYLNNPTLFSAAFTLHGTITLDSPANSTYYGDGLNSLIEFNLTDTPEPSAWALMACGAGMLCCFRQLRKAPKNVLLPRF